MTEFATVPTKYTFKYVHESNVNTSFKEATSQLIFTNSSCEQTRNTSSRIIQTVDDLSLMRRQIESSSVHRITKAIKENAISEWNREYIIFLGP